MRTSLFLFLAALAAAQSPGCDPAIHDKIPGAQFRSATDCEIKFDAGVRAALAKALKPAVDALIAQGWIVEKQSKPAIKDDARNMEKKFFRMDFTDAGGFNLTLSMARPNPEAARLMKELVDATQKAADQMKVRQKPSMEEAQRLGRQLQGSTHIAITAVINFDFTAFVNFKGDYTRSEIAGGGFALYAPYAQAPTGGGEDASLETTFLFLGHWGAPAVRKDGDGGEQVRVPAAFHDAAPKLSVENLRIRIEANQALAQMLLKQMDWSALRPLLPR